MAPPRWEHFEHQADIGVRGIGGSIEEAFEQAALAVTAVITNPRDVGTTQRIDVSCEAPDRESLLYDWLNAIVYEMATRSMLFGRYEVRIDRNHLSGSAWGEKVDVAKHEPAVEVKGATYTDIQVGQGRDGAWIAQCVVDV